MAAINKKVKAATLIEVLVAMVIIMVIFGMAIQVFTNVIGSSVTAQKVRAQAQLQILSREIQETGFLPQHNLTLDSINYEFNTSSSHLNGMAKLEIKAIRQEKLLASIKCLYQPKNEPEN